MLFSWARLQPCVEGQYRSGQEQTTLWWAGARGSGGGKMGAESHSLGSAGEEVLNPGACERREAQGDQFFDQNVRVYCIKC